MSKFVGFPVYPVIVMAPLLVVKVNWTCAAAEVTNDNTTSRQVAIWFRLMFILVNICPPNFYQSDGYCIALSTTSAMIPVEAIALAEAANIAIMSVGCRGKPAGKQTPH